MTIVSARDGESGETLITRFTKLVQRDGILREFKRRRHFISKSEQRRIDAQKAARKRARRAARLTARPTRPYGARPAGAPGFARSPGGDGPSSGPGPGAF